MDGLASILLVDDNPKYLADALPMYGYDVTVVTNGIDALKELGKDDKHFDLVLLDVMMPQMNGWDTLKAIRSNKEHQYLPVIMITAVNEDQKIVSGLKIGADDYIVKPFILPNLLARMEAILRRCQWQNENTKKNDVVINTDNEIEALTSREKEVLGLVAKGATNQDIAEKLFVRDVTVKTHLNSIFKKLKVTNRTQAVLLAMQMNLINRS